MVDTAAFALSPLEINPFFHRWYALCYCFMYKSRQAQTAGERRRTALAYVSRGIAMPEPTMTEGLSASVTNQNRNFEKS
ncbi:UNVERIFIED_CONTAM: hypothetical protein ABID98_000069 [Brevibacillus sp. OAP136]